MKCGAIWMDAVIYIYAAAPVVDRVVCQIEAVIW